MPRDPTCPFSHCPAEKSSGCFPIIPEIPPCLPLRPQDCPLPSPHPPTPTSLPPLTPSRAGSPFSQPKTPLERPSQTPYPASELSYLPYFLALVTTWNHSSCSTLFLFVSLHQTEAPGNQGTLPRLILQHPPGPQSRCSK